MKKLVLTISFVVLIALPATKSFAQPKTTSSSPCVQYGTSSKNPEYVGMDLVNLDYPQCNQATASLTLASYEVLGQRINLTSGDFGDKYKVMNYLIDIGNKPVWKTRFDAGLDKKNAKAYIRETAKPNEYRYENVFWFIYGRAATGFEKLFFGKAIETKEMIYIDIWNNEKEKFLKNPAEQEAVINRAFQEVKKRPANPDEIKEWKPKKLIYSALVERLKK